LGGIDKLQHLEEFWVKIRNLRIFYLNFKINNNKIENFQDLDILKTNPTIKTVYLSANPVANFPSYRETLMSILPNLEQIDHFPLKVTYNFKSKQEEK